MSSAQLPMQMNDVNDPERRSGAGKKARKISEAIDKQLKAEKEEKKKKWVNINRSFIDTRVNTRSILLSVYYMRIIRVLCMYMLPIYS